MVTSVGWKLIIYYIRLILVITSVKKCNFNAFQITFLEQKYRAPETWLPPVGAGCKWNKFLSNHILFIFGIIFIFGFFLTISVSMEREHALNFFFHVKKYKFTKKTLITANSAVKTSCCFDTKIVKTTVLNSIKFRYTPSQFYHEYIALKICPQLTSPAQIQNHLPTETQKIAHITFINFKRIPTPPSANRCFIFTPSLWHARWCCVCRTGCWITYWKWQFWW